MEATAIPQNLVVSIGASLLSQGFQVWEGCKLVGTPAGWRSQSSLQPVLAGGGGGGFLVAMAIYVAGVVVEL